eukprot:TRINITY_DN21472_c0_g1_i1.p1 TRINITY_DN21472_c0_g1~~TRINITY_DN21472_c0_g1_i1.p1  ORF type:complete len:349 (+),score=59.22 TRINITY_DN21472_c0_g1_i1:48-1049(+)
MSSKDRELKFDKSVMYEVLKQCMVASIVDKGLTKQADLYPLVVKTIAYKCGYVANVLRSIRHAISRLHTRQKEIKTGEQYITLTQSGAWSTYGSVSVSQLSISIVGCGIVGTELLENLVNSRLFHPTCFVVSTRQPNTLSTYSKMGLNVCFNNTLAGSHADVLFLCCSPNHFADVSPSLRGNLKPSTIVVSTLLGVTKERLCSVLNHPHCMTVSVDIPGISPLPSLPKHDNAQLVKASCPFITPDDYLTFTSLLLPAIPSSLPSPLLFSAILASTLNTPTAALLISHVLTTPPVKKEQGLGKFGGLAAFEALLEGTLQEHAAKRYLEVVQRLH